MKKDNKQKGTAIPLKQGQIKAWLIILLGMFCTCVSFAQMPTIKQGPKEVVTDELFDINGNLCYYSMVCSKYKYPSDVAATQDPRLLQTKLREIILDNDGNETVNVIDGKGVAGIAAQSYAASKTKRLFLLMEQGLIKSDVRLVVVE